MLHLNPTDRAIFWGGLRIYMINAHHGVLPRYLYIVLMVKAWLGVSEKEVCVKLGWKMDCCIGDWQSSFPSAFALFATMLDVERLVTSIVGHQTVSLPLVIRRPSVLMSNCFITKPTVSLNRCSQWGYALTE
jgi:hypothetical protein